MTAAFDYVFAVPGDRTIIDVIHPSTGLSLAFSETLEQVQARYPQAQRMHYDEWSAGVAASQNVPLTWNASTAEEYDEMLNVLPPAYWAGNLFLVGEPTDHDVMSGRPRFSAFMRNGDAYMSSSRPVTIAEAKESVSRWHAEGGR